MSPHQIALRPTASPRKIGYLRISTKAQLADRQVLQLEEACDDLRIEQVSAVADARPVLEALLAELLPGDTFVVLDLDRAFRSTIDAILTAEALHALGIGFKVLSFPIDTATEEGELFFTILAAFAQFERRIISRRTREGMEAARKRGSKIGRPARLSTDVISQAYEWMVETKLPCAYVAALLGVSRLTLQRGFHKLGLVYPLG
ncbi:MAG: recombinase family protein [Pseudomonadota bacterium]